MGFDSDIILIPMTLFLTVVMPIWIVFHYITIWRREKRQRRQEKTSYVDLQAQAERMEERLDAIESILDTDAPEWRSRS